MTQSTLAEAAGCRQSAICMMERGHPRALAAEKMETVADLLGVPPADGKPREEERGDIRAARTFCPVYDCPTNRPFVVGGVLRFLPVPPQALRNGRYCAMCGEVLEDRCVNPSCRAPLNEGACCAVCGSAYVEGPHAPADPAGWADAQRRRLAEMNPEKGC